VRQGNGSRPGRRLGYAVEIGSRSGFVLVVLLASARAATGDPPDQPFAATPKQLLAAAAAVKDGDAVTVLHDVRATVDGDGRVAEQIHNIIAIRTAAGLDEVGTFGAYYSPYYQDRPSLRARVIGLDGSVAELDASLTAESPAVSDSPQVFSDRRHIVVPLPKLVVGAVIEEELVIRDREPQLAGGTAQYIYIGGPMPVQRTTVAITGPTAKA
jgi:hypothetical protein